ncbi:hypothetical protein EVAR_56061_1 [Eumeta japonica]|uniref:Uncharacterized protein n=1 Tax=Eumeta variegata TaxID=151549 RepID=A0A4C1YAF5_EUMVA|nr:hypothetical protein EVAR_56061_1 [Eumeta japonica]
MVRYVMVVKAGYDRRKMKVGSMRWRYDLCVVCAECHRKIDVGTVMSKLFGLKEDVVTRVERETHFTTPTFKTAGSDYRARFYSEVDSHACTAITAGKPAFDNTQ